MQHVINQVNLPSFYRMYDIPFLFDSNSLLFTRSVQLIIIAVY